MQQRKHLIKSKKCNGVHNGRKGSELSAQTYNSMQIHTRKCKIFAAREMQCTLQNGRRSSNANPYKAMQINFKQLIFFSIKCNGLQNGLRGCSEQCHGKLSFKAIFSNVFSRNLMGVKTLLSAQHIGDLIDVNFLQNHKSLNEIVCNF